MTHLSSSLLLGALALFALEYSVQAADAFRDAFSDGRLDRWRIKEGTWRVRDGRAIAEGGYSMLVQTGGGLRDVDVTADVGYSHDEAHAAAGIAFRLGEDSTGYAVGLREIEKGLDPEFGPWERPVIQLFRLDRDGWTLLQESKVMGCRSGVLRRLRVVCRGPAIWVYYADMATPILKEFDDRYDRAGAVGLWKDHRGLGLYDNVRDHVRELHAPPPLRTDWSWVRGAVYVRSDAVNSVQMWHDYWDHTDCHRPRALLRVPVRVQHGAGVPALDRLGPPRRGVSQADRRLPDAGIQGRPEGELHPLGRLRPRRAGPRVRRPRARASQLADDAEPVASDPGQRGAS